MGLPMWDLIPKREDFPKSNFGDKRQSDISFLCFGKLFYVHRHILKSKRGFLELFGNPRRPFEVVMRENRSISPHETPVLATAMLRWCYTGVLIASAAPFTGSFPRIHNIDKNMFRVCVLSYAVAVEHGIDSRFLDAILETFRQNLVFFIAASMVNLEDQNNASHWPITPDGVMNILELILRTTKDSDSRLKDLVFSAVSNNFRDLSVGMQRILRDIDGLSECILSYRG